MSCNETENASTYFKTAEKNGQLVNEGIKRCSEYAHAWLAYADSSTGLLPENLVNRTDIWSIHNSAADNYPFLVLTLWLIDSTLFNGTMINILKTETELTSRVGKLPDGYSFSKRGFADENVNMDRIIFGASEYAKDGLLPVTELLGSSPWSQRMIDLIDGIWANAPIQTKYGLIPSTNIEVNGEQLQLLARVYWMTGDHKYLDWAVRLGDYYLLDNHHPTRNFELLRLRDHGCEIVDGLCELYATVNFALPEKKQQYEKPIHEMLDRILEVGRNEDGMFYNFVNPQTGEIIDSRIADTYGYVYNGFYTVYLIDKENKYRDAVLHALSSLKKYRNFDWEAGSADGFADAIESALNLYNRESLPDVADWIDSEMKIMWSLQDSSYRESAQQWKNSGIIEGWYGDGNFARTTIMYCFWKTQGVFVSPWKEDVIVGADYKNNELYLSIKSAQAWKGKILFDTQRYKDGMKLPIDFPRINQFPEWYTINPQMQYEVKNVTTNSTRKYKGSDLEKGMFIKLDANISYMLKIKQIH
ncbi:hypothetical protein JW960_22825 [candidate division KSB1 bacterium]|nr:hypothetical protein [candidate division KSB1 bacterium]